MGEAVDREVLAGGGYGDALWPWFSDLYGETVDPVYRFALVLTGAAQPAEELTARTYAQAWRERERLWRQDARLPSLFSLARATAHGVGVAI